MSSKKQPRRSGTAASVLQEEEEQKADAMYEPTSSDHDNLSDRDSEAQECDEQQEDENESVSGQQAGASASSSTALVPPLPRTKLILSDYQIKLLRVYCNNTPHNPTRYERGALAHELKVAQAQIGLWMRKYRLQKRKPMPEPSTQTHVPKRARPHYTSLLLPTFQQCEEFKQRVDALAATRAPELLNECPDVRATTRSGLRAARLVDAQARIDQSAESERADVDMQVRQELMVPQSTSSAARTYQRLPKLEDATVAMLSEYYQLHPELAKAAQRRTPAGQEILRTLALKSPQILDHEQISHWFDRRARRVREMYFPHADRLNNEFVRLKSDLMQMVCNTVLPHIICDTTTLFTPDGETDMHLMYQELVPEKWRLALSNHGVATRAEQAQRLKQVLNTLTPSQLRAAWFDFHDLTVAARWMRRFADHPDHELHASNCKSPFPAPGTLNIFTQFVAQEQAAGWPKVPVEEQQKPEVQAFWQWRLAPDTASMEQQCQQLRLLALVYHLDFFVSKEHLLILLQAWKRICDMLAPQNIAQHSTPDLYDVMLHASRAFMAQFTSGKTGTELAEGEQERTDFETALLEYIGFNNGQPCMRLLKFLLPPTAWSAGTIQQFMLEYVRYLRKRYSWNIVPLSASEPIQGAPPAPTDGVLTLNAENLERVTGSAPAASGASPMVKIRRVKKVKPSTAPTTESLPAEENVDMAEV